jgi:hypothetical protein
MGRVALMVVSLMSSLAWAEAPLPPTLSAGGALQLSAPTRVDMDSVFNGAIHSAGFAVDSGKLAFMRRGRPVNATVGRSTLTPLVDFNFGGATAVMRFVF